MSASGLLLLGAVWSDRLKVAVAVVMRGPLPIPIKTAAKSMCHHTIRVCGG